MCGVPAWRPPVPHGSSWAHTSKDGFSDCSSHKKNVCFQDAQGKKQQFSHCPPLALALKAAAAPGGDGPAGGPAPFPSTGWGFLPRKRVFCARFPAAVFEHLSSSFSLNLKHS